MVSYHHGRIPSYGTIGEWPNLTAMTAPAASPDRVPMSMLLAALGRDVTARVRRTMRPLGLGVQQFLVLDQLRVLGDASQVELSEAVGIDPSNLATIVADLCDRGLALRTRHRTDRRRYALQLSSAGQRLLRRADASIAAAEDDLLATLDGQQREQLYGLLRQLADGVDLCPTAGDDGCHN
jgi:DNA-binding MarR family transcriptional regulator